MPIPAAESAVPPPEIPPSVPPVPPPSPEENRGAFGPPPIQEGNPFAGAGAPPQGSSGTRDGGNDPQFGPGAAPGTPANPFQAPGDYAPQWTEGAASGIAAPLDLGDVFSRAWAAFADQWGICVGAVFLVWVMSVALTFGLMIFIGAVAPMNQGGPEVMVFLLIIPLALLGVWLNIGQLLVFLSVARGRPTSLETLFSGGRFMVGFIAAGILFFLGFYLGLILLIVPGVIFALTFSQMFYLILDRNLGVFEAFGESKRITRGNRLTLLAIFILLIVLALPSAIPLLGLLYNLFYVPFSMLVVATAYLRMTGQPTAH